MSEKISNKKISVNKNATPATGWFNLAPGSYLESTARPLYSVLFLLPLIVIYELGTILVNTEQVGQYLTRKCVIAFIWLTWLAQGVGMPSRLVWLFPGFVVVVIMISWHIASRQSWRVKGKWLGWMVIESIILTLPLLLLNAAIGSSAITFAAGIKTVETKGPSYAAYIVTGIGAGIYEELVFRLILVGLFLLIQEDVARIKTTPATIIAVFISALLFATHHYLGFERGKFTVLQGETFTLVGFLFRMLAGLYFAVVFRYRGYGITAGTHAAYDILLTTFWP